MAQNSSQPSDDDNISSWQAIINRAANQAAPDPLQASVDHPMSADPTQVLDPSVQAMLNPGPTPLASIGDPATVPSSAAMKQVPAVAPHAPALRIPGGIQSYMEQERQAMKEQHGGLDELQQYIEDMQNKPAGINWTPLAAWADSLLPNNSHLADAAKSMAPMTPEQRDQMLFNLRDKLQSGKAAVSKEYLDALGEQMKMQYQLQHAADEKRHWDNEDQANLNRSGSFSLRNLIQQDNQAQKAGDVFDKDTLSNTLMQRYQQVGIDRHTLENSDVVPTQMMNEMAAGLASAITGSKAVGVEATKMQQLNSLEGDISKLQSYAGKPMNALQPAQRQFLISTFDRLQGAYANAINDRKDALRNGRNYSYNPAANVVLNTKGKHIPVPTAQGGPVSAPTTGMVQDGHRFKGGDPGNPSSWEKVN